MNRCQQHLRSGSEQPVRGPEDPLRPGARALAKQKQVAALVRLIPRDLADTPDLANAIKNTDVGTYDPCTHDGRVVVVVFDSKQAGEASSKAPQRLPPLQQDECRRLLDAVRSRHGAEDELPDGDFYLFLDGRGIMDRMTSYFIGKHTSPKRCTYIWIRIV